MTPDHGIAGAALTAPSGEPRVRSAHEPGAFLSTLAPGPVQRRLAVTVIVVSGAVFVALVPFAKIPLGQVWAFIPIYESATIVNDLITATLLFGQFVILRSRALAILATGYLFTAFIAIAHMLSFPGLFGPTGLLGAGPQTTAWLYMFWHGVFPLLVIAYAWYRGRSTDPIDARGGPGLVVASCVTAAAAVTLLLTALATARADLLPAVMSGNRYTPALIWVVGCAWALNAAALYTLWRQKDRSVLDLWMLVVMWAWLFDIGLAAVVNAGRFDLGFYAGRIFGLLASSFVLLVLLLENGALYARLARKTGEINAVNESLERRVEARTAELNDAQHRLSGIIDSAMDAIISVTEDQRIVLFNATAEVLFDCPQEQAIGAPLSTFIPERFRDAHGDHVRRFGQGNVPSRRMAGQRVVTGLRRNGEEFPIDASISHTTLKDGRYYTVVVRDVTERLRAEEALRRSKEELFEMASMSSAAREQEKRRIARELHDELAQSLTMLRMDVAWLRKQAADGAVMAKHDSMEEILARSVGAVRRIAADLRPLMLDDLGLVPAAEWLVKNFRERYGVACDLVVEPADLQMDDPQATAVFRIMQEALANVARHAGASQVDISLRHDGGEITLQVRDDGRGFDPASARKPNSFGIVGLRERAHLVDGVIAIETAPGRGTVIDVRIPIVRA
jgi:PAS domain S-box-containing protein